MIDRHFDFIAPRRALRELAILGEVASGEAVSLRGLAARTGLGRTMTHEYIGRMQAEGLLCFEMQKARRRYRLTEQGARRLDALVFGASREVVQLYGIVKREFRSRLRRLARDGARRVVLCGAAETAELVHAAAEGSGLEIVGIVDSDPEKQGRGIGALRVGAPEALPGLAPDLALITSHGHAGEIQSQVRRLVNGSVRIARI